MERRWVTSASYGMALDVVIAARKTAQLSQRELAERLGKPRSFVSKIENRERRIDFVEFVAIAQALSVPADEMMKRVASVLGGDIEF